MSTAPSPTAALPPPRVAARLGDLAYGKVWEARSNEDAGARDAAAAILVDFIEHPDDYTTRRGIGWLLRAWVATMRFPERVDAPAEPATWTWSNAQITVHPGRSVVQVRLHRSDRPPVDIIAVSDGVDVMLPGHVVVADRADVRWFLGEG